MTYLEYRVGMVNTFGGLTTSRGIYLVGNATLVVANVLTCNKYSHIL
jgi:hypothetical protein